MFRKFVACCGFAFLFGVLLYWDSEKLKGVWIGLLTAALGACFYLGKWALGGKK